MRRRTSKAAAWLVASDTNSNNIKLTACTKIYTCNSMWCNAVEPTADVSTRPGCKIQGVLATGGCAYGTATRSHCMSFSPSTLSHSDRAFLRYGSGLSMYMLIVGYNEQRAAPALAVARSHQTSQSQPKPEREANGVVQRLFWYCKSAHKPLWPMLERVWQDPQVTDRGACAKDARADIADWRRQWGLVLQSLLQGF